MYFEALHIVTQIFMYVFYVLFSIYYFYLPYNKFFLMEYKQWTFLLQICNSFEHKTPYQF